MRRKSILRQDRPYCPFKEETMFVVIKWILIGLFIAFTWLVGAIRWNTFDRREGWGSGPRRRSN